MRKLTALYIANIYIFELPTLKFDKNITIGMEL